MASFLDECPICYNAYQEPKGLPCLHSFCRECLQNHINNNSIDGVYFYCPMCRMRISPFGDKCLPVCEWAKSFPTNNYILVNQSQDVPHKNCPTHQNEIVDISCRTCRLMICSQCCLSTHERCEKTISKYNAKKIKRKFLLHKHKIATNLDPLEKRLSNLDERKELMETQIKQMSEELSDFVRNQELYWLQEIEASHSKESIALLEQRENLVQIMRLLEENVNDIDNLVGEQDTDDELASPSTLEYQPRHVVMDLKTDITKVEELNFEINPNFAKLKDELLKENLVEKMEDPVPDQINDATTDTGNRLLIREVNLDSETLVGINDMVMLPDQTFLITEACFKKLWKFSANGQLLQALYFDTEPFGMCLLEDSCVAISQPYDRKITFLDWSNFNGKANFISDKRYYGLGSDNNERIFALYRDQFMWVDIISRDSPQYPYEVFDTIKLPNMFYFCDDYRLRVLATGDVLIMNSANSLNVACIDQDGIVTFRYEGEPEERLYSLGDIAVGEDFIYIADKTMKKIHRIQYDGSFVDIPLTPDHGITHIKKIFVSDGNELAVLLKTNQNSKILLFSC